MIYKSIIYLLINILLSTGLMSFFIYIFYFFIITNIEKNIFKKILNSNIIKSINNGKPIVLTPAKKESILKKNKIIINKARLYFFSYGFGSIIISIFLIKIFSFNIYEILIHNSVILISTLIAELLFVLVYTKKYIIFDNFTFLKYSIETINSVLNTNIKYRNNPCSF